MFDRDARLNASQFLAAFAFLLFCSGFTRAQGTSQYDHGTPPQHAAGLGPVGSYASADLGTVNLSNGALNFRLPLGELGGRGFTLPLTLNYSSKVWSAAMGRDVVMDPIRREYEAAYAVYDNLESPSEYYQRLPAGWTLGAVPSLHAVGVGLYPVQNNNGCMEALRAVVRLTVLLPDKGEIELRDDVRDGAPLGALHDRWGCRRMDGYRGRRWHATDGSGAIFLSDADNGVVNGDLNGTLVTADGMRYRFRDTAPYETSSIHLNEFARADLVTDRHGNQIRIEYSALMVEPRTATIRFTDQLGRITTVEINAPDPAGGPTLAALITLPGYGGRPLRYKVHKGLMNQHYRPGADPGVPVYNGDLPGRENDCSVSSPHVSLFPTSWCGGKERIDTRDVVTALSLPDGRSLEFRYNVYGEVAEARMPTGGKVQYDYEYEDGLPAGNSPAFETVPSPGTGNVRQIDRAVKARRVYPDGQAIAARWSYEYTATSGVDGSATGGVAEVVAKDSDGVTVRLRRKHYFLNAGRYLKRDGGTGYTLWSTGLERRSETLDAAGAVVAATEQDWSQRAPVVWTTDYAQEQPQNDNRVGEERKFLDTGAVAKVGYSYDQYNNATEVKEYDYDQSLKRRTVTSYLNANANAYGYQTDDRIRLLRLPAVTTVYDGAGNRIAETSFAYDEAAYPILAYGSVSGWSAPETPARGNATTVSRWLNTPNSWLSTHAQYDQAGNVVSSTDARGNTSTVSYSDAFHNEPGHNTYAFPTSTTSAVPAPSPGPYAGRGSSTPLTTSTVYDYWTGLVRSSKDANNQITSYEYNDALDRPTMVSRPDGGWTEFWYDRNAYGDYVGTRTAINATQKTEGYQFFDGLGRPARSFQYDGSRWITTDTQYDALGRAWRVSANPYLSGGSGSPVNPSNHWVETTFDSLGRVTHVKTTADGAQIVTSYSGNTVTVTDQAGRQRKSVSDALGRLTQVVEAPGAGDCLPSGAGCATDYLYDALGNLRRVEQGTQYRHFMYDSLSRLVRAKNPEQDSNASLATTPDPVSGNTQWSLGYSYDANSNLHQRTDARGVTATYTYDQINRLIRTDYSDGTPFTLLTYDFAQNGRGRFHANYESSTEGTINYVHAYDEVGRPVSGSANFFFMGAGWLPAYAYSREYDLAGNVTKQTYPSGRTVSYNYDVAGRLADYGGQAAFSGNLGDGALRTYSTAVSYDEAGRMRQERFGTAQPLYHKRHHNARGQLYDVRLSTLPLSTDQWNWNRGAVVLWYGHVGTPHGQSSADNNGNVAMSHSSVPLNEQATVYSYHERHYEYDALNRLSWVTEQAGTQAGLGGVHARQAYAYDRWGNRQIDAAGTWLGQPSSPPSHLLNEKQFAVDAATNRLGAPGQPAAMQYDAAGNLTHDTYTGVGARTYDAENRMTSARGPGASGGAYQNRYVYDAAGKRMRRKTEAGEAWQVYGFDGELIAEYAAAAAPTQPQKEYGYRAGELLVVAEAGSGYSSEATSAFSASQNPAGPWAYGYRPAGGPFNLLSTPSAIFGAGTATWAVSAQSCCPTVTKNTTGTTHSYPNAPNVVQPTDTLNLHPGPAGERAVARWTAPESGTYTIAGRFQGLDTYGTTTDARIEHNGTTLFSTQVNGYGAQAAFNLTRTVGAGESVEFSAGYGANLNYECDSTGLAVTVTRAGSQPAVRWLVTDHLGTPRITADLSGSLAGIRRHDYLPFGEEIGAGVGGRTEAQGYSVVDGVRQKFTGKERDDETGVDYFGARYYASTLGRFTGVDPKEINFEKNQAEFIAYLNEPQNWNRYAYALNNPLQYIDPNGKEPVKSQAGTVATFIKVLNESPSKVGQQRGADAEKALKRLGETEWTLGGPKPKTTPYFNTKEGRYIYTEKGGWIDMVHFLFYAGAAYEYKQSGEKNPIGEAMQDGYHQEALDPTHSAYSYEDLPSDKFGADFAVNHFDPNSKLTLGEQVQNYLNNVLGATDPRKAPNYNNLPQEDTKKKPTRLNKSTKPVYTKENP